MASKTGERSRRALHALLLGLVVLAGYGFSLQGEFVWDDRMLIVENDRVQDSDRLPELFTSSFWDIGDRHDRFRAFFRPVVGFSYFVDHALWGLDPFGYHLTNTLLHFICCLLVYAIARQESVGPWPSLAAAALFAAHPVHVESVAWISGRTDVLCAALVLGAFLAYRRAETASRSNSRLFVAALLFALALFAKEMAATLPLLVFADRWLARRRLVPALRASWPFFLTLAAYLGIRYGLIGGMGESLVAFNANTFVATAAFVVGRYLTMLILPLGLDAHYPYEALTSLFSVTVLIALTMLGIVVFCGWRLARRGSQAAFWLLWILLTLTPVMTFGRFGDVILADRFLYIPSVGLSLIVARGLHRISLDQSRNAVRWATVAAIALVALLTAATMQRSRVWADDYTLFSDMRRTSPGSALVRCNLGLALYERGEIQAAINEYRVAIALEPSYAMAHNNLAVALQAEGRRSEAVQHYMAALKLVPGLLEASVNAGYLFTHLGKTDLGIAMLQDAVTRHPRYAPAHYALADSLERSGRVEQALRHLETAGNLSPNYANVHYLTGKILYDRRNFEPAAREMTRFLELWPADDDTWSQAARAVIRRSKQESLPAFLGPSVPPANAAGTP